MLADIKNRKSLAFYYSLPEPNGVQMVTNSVDSFAAGSITAQAGRNVYIYNQEYQTILKGLNLERARLADKVTRGLERDMSYRGARGDGVSLAWKYEKADVQMGGTGSAGWNRTERDEIMARGRAKGAEGHHQKNVSSHLEEQANPDNIKFYKSKEEHLQKGHQGKWDNETDAPLIDKNKMLRNTNQKRVLKQELCGLGKATAIGLGIGFSLTFIAEIAKSGFLAEEIESAMVKGGIGGIESAAIVAAGYGMGLLTSSLLQNAGINLASKAGQLLNGTAAGMLSILMVSVYQLANVQLEGDLDAQILGQVGCNAAYSASVLAVSMIAQSLLGGSAGILVSTAAGAVLYLAEIAKTVKEKQMQGRLREYAIEQYRG